MLASSWESGCGFKGGAVLQWFRVLCSLRAGERVGQRRVAWAPGAPCLCRLSQESFRVSSVILCFLFSPPSLCCLSQFVLWNMIRFQLQAAALSHVGAGFKAFWCHSLVLHQKNKTTNTYIFVLHFVKGDNWKRWNFKHAVTFLFCHLSHLSTLWAWGSVWLV